MWIDKSVTAHVTDNNDSLANTYLHQTIYHRLKKIQVLHRIQIWTSSNTDTKLINLFIY
jgi:hypothetical protein